jgi:hypothetical protein
MITGGIVSRRVEGGPQPLDLAGLQRDHVEAAGRLLRQSHQVMAGGEDDPPLLDGTDAGRGAAERRAGPPPHLHEHQRAVAVAHHQVDFAAAAARGPIIARYQPQARRFQVGERTILGGIAGLLGGGRLSREIH